MSRFLQPVGRAWLATGPVGAPNYDEFSDCAAVRALISSRPGTVLPVDMPQCTEQAQGLSFEGSLPLAVRDLQAMKDDGRYAALSQTVFLYEMSSATGDSARAVLGLVSTDEVSSRNGERGRILRNEDVFADKVAQRRAHLQALRHLISPVLLVPRGDGVGPALEAAFAAVPGPPAVSDTDERGVTHRVWPLIDPAAAGALHEVLDREVFLVADGNHRSLAAQQAGLGFVLAVVAAPEGLRIDPYNRLLRLGLSGEEVVQACAQAGLQLTPVAAVSADDSYLHVAGRSFRLGFPVPPAADAVAALPHTIVENALLTGVLGLDPASPEIAYVGGADQLGGLVAAVDGGSAAAALLLRPVTTAEFVAVNAARQQMPRKSTWFLPKARSGLVLAQL